LLLPPSVLVSIHFQPIDNTPTWKYTAVWQVYYKK